MRPILYILILLAATFAPAVSAQILETKNFIIKIESHCEEGVIVCDHVTYIGTSKKSGNSIKLKGHDLARMCADGVTPCQFIGHEFINGNITYFVSQDGLLEVIQKNGKVLVSEQGEWR